jgi:hypothetical protein
MQWVEVRALLYQLPLVVKYAAPFGKSSAAFGSQ